MVIDSNTLEPLHKLSEEGKENYKKYLVAKADEILFKHEHPFKYLWNKIRDFFHISYVDDDYTDYMM